MPWVTVAEAAERLRRSPQWVRDRIRAGDLRAVEKPAGSRIRLFVDGSDVDRMAADLLPVPTMPDHRVTHASGHTFDVETVLAAGYMDDLDELRATVSELDRRLRQVESDRDDLYDMLMISLRRYKRETNRDVVDR